MFFKLHSVCHFGTYGTASIDRATGDVLWKNDELHVEHQNGPGSSPVVWKDKGIIHFDGTDNQFIAALELATGKVAWQTTRSGKMDETLDLKKAYGKPISRFLKSPHYFCMKTGCTL